MKRERIRLYVAEHRLIYEAVVNGDADAAAFAMLGAAHQKARVERSHLGLAGDCTMHLHLRVPVLGR